MGPFYCGLYVLFNVVENQVLYKKRNKIVEEERSPYT